MKTLFVVLLVVLMTGCTTYGVEKQAPDGSYTKVKVSSTRSFEAPDLHYKRTPEGAEFDFSAANADNNTDAFLGMFNGMMQMMLQMMKTVE